MLANGISFLVVVILTPLLSKQTLKDSRVALSVLVIMQAVAVVLILLVRKETKSKKEEESKESLQNTSDLHN
jgi:hypothetical protein